MEESANAKNIKSAARLMDDFARRTGIIGDDGPPERRYLWTDAFAVQTLFDLSSRLPDNIEYRNRALRLIDMVHHTLGRYRADDSRTGWISGRDEEQGAKHPTAGGLRIGKPVPERRVDEPYNEQFEWDRDGQYYHYIIQWINALLHAARDTGDRKFSVWALELAIAGGRFIAVNGGRSRMYWKMSIDLTRPLVSSMGAHDPLDGLISLHCLLAEFPEKKEEVKDLLRNLESIASQGNWITDDPLGIGGLFLNVRRGIELLLRGFELPDSVNPVRLFKDAIVGLQFYKDREYEPEAPALMRLAFRECGLSLGIKALNGIHSEFTGLDKRDIEPFLPLAREIEDFWMRPENLKSATWIEHLDINEVTLASSLIAGL